MTDKMDAAELTRVRATLGFSQDVLAADLGLPPAVVVAWEDGRGSIPRHVAKDLRWRAAITERQQAIEASGLPECTWAEAFEARPVPEKAETQVKHWEELLAHSDRCPECLARTAFIDAHCPPLPPQPMPFWFMAFDAIGKVQLRLPVWARPAVSVGIVFGAYSLLRAVLWIPRMLAQPKYILIALGGITLSMAAGAGVGLLYGIARHLWRERTSRRIA